MSAALSFVGSPEAEGPRDRFVGPATVVSAGPASLEARLPSGEVVRPQLALAFTFTPAPGDTLLVIGQGGRHFVIGVIASTGLTELEFQGDVELRAVGGELHLAGDRGVAVHGPEIELKAKNLTVLAEKASEAFGAVLTRVRTLLSVHAGAVDTVVAGEWSHRSERAAITSEEVVSINGKEVHLG